jgi:hypothetical protein
MIITCEIVEIKERKTASLDKVYTITLRTDDNQVMALSAIPADCLVEVTIEKEKT